MEIKTFEDVNELNRFAAERFVELAKSSIAARGRFTVALSGGSTPKKLYSRLAAEPFRSAIDWPKIHFFFGDERLVSPDDEQSNYRMARESLFDKIELPAANIHRFLTENGEAVAIAAAMESEIRAFFELDDGEFPRFDLVFLGMGADGHTTSLFPETDALMENTRIVVENFVPKFETFRLTFTFPAINHARSIIFLIAGQDKRDTLDKVLHGEFQPEKLPSQSVKPIDGELLILTDIKM